MTPTRVAINGFGRVGRLALRAGWGRGDLDFVHVNETKGDAATAAHLLTFDSVHGRWDRAAQGEKEGDTLTVDGRSLGRSGTRQLPILARSHGSSTAPKSCWSARGAS